MWVCKGVSVTVALHPPKEVTELLEQKEVPGCQRVLEKQVCSY